jgi:hypothetical protein
MRKPATTCATLLVWLLASCATTVENPRRLGDLQSAPGSLHFIWSSAKAPAFSNLPALGAAAVGTSGSKFFENYPVEYSSFGSALKQKLETAPALNGKATVDELQLSHSQQQLEVAIQRASGGAAVVVMYPERVTSFCSPGCYAFKVRVNYLSPGSRSEVWTGVVDSPPKARHSDPFDVLAANFSEALVKQLAVEGLLPK